MMRRTTLALGAAAVSAALAMSGCAVKSGRSATGSTDAKCPWKPDTSVKTSARIAWQKIPNADLIVKDRGVLEACMPNAKITWSNFASGGDVVQAYGAKSVDLGLMGSSPATTALSPPLNMDVKVVWIHDVIGDAESLIVRDPKITDLKGLKGHTIAVPFGSTSHYSLLQALQDAGMDSSKDVKLINLEPDKMPSAWQGKQIDAAWVWDPVQSQLKSSGGHAVISSADTAKAGKPTYDLGTASGAFVDQNAAFMKQWAKAEDYGVTMIKDDPDKAAESIAVQLGIKPDEVKKQFPGYEYLGAAQQADQQHLGGQMAKDLTATSKFLLGQGSIDKMAAPSVYQGGVDATPSEDASQ